MHISPVNSDFFASSRLREDKSSAMHYVFLHNLWFVLKNTRIEQGHPFSSFSKSYVNTVDA